MERTTAGSGSFSLDHDCGSPRDFELAGSMGVECSEATPLETVERGRLNRRVRSEPFFERELLLLRDSLSPDSVRALRRVRRFGVRRPVLAGLWSRLGTFLGDGDREPDIHDCDMNRCESDLDSVRGVGPASPAGAAHGPAPSLSALATELVKLSSERVSEPSCSSSRSPSGTTPPGTSANWTCTVVVAGPMRSSSENDPFSSRLEASSKIVSLTVGR